MKARKIDLNCFPPSFTAFPYVSNFEGGGNEYVFAKRGLCIDR